MTPGVQPGAGAEDALIGRPPNPDGTVSSNNADHSIAWIGLGSNMQNPVYQLEQAVSRLLEDDQLEVLKVSSFYQTPPWGDHQQDDFINAVLKLKTRLDPVSLLRRLQAIEDLMGRRRGKRRWGPRLIDLDLLMYDDLQYQSDDLQIPHPRMHERAFVLVPLCELDQAQEIPGFGNVGNLIKSIDVNNIRRLASRADSA